MLQGVDGKANPRWMGRRSLHEQSVVARGAALMESWWQQQGASHPDPRTASEGEVCLSTYRQHVQGGVVPPKGAPHLKSHLLPLQRQALIRFRVGSYPLRIATAAMRGMAVPTHRKVEHGVRGALPVSCGPAGSVRSQGRSRTCSTFFWNVRLMRMSGSRGVKHLVSRLLLHLCWGNVISAGWQRRCLGCCSSVSYFFKAGVRE
jgi:hypothetical protein